MKSNKKSLKAHEFRISIEKHVSSQMKNPAYRKTYLVSGVRVEIARLIKTLREQASVSQSQLAKLAGIPQSQVARLEGTADKRIPSMDLLANIFAALDCRAFLDVIPKKPHAEKREIVLV